MELRAIARRIFWRDSSSGVSLLVIHALRAAGMLVEIEIGAMIPETRNF
jgi:hypothetical protein